MKIANIYALNMHLQDYIVHSHIKYKILHKYAFINNMIWRKIIYIKKTWEKINTQESMEVRQPL
jgi:hypothetical protein